MSDHALLSPSSAHRWLNCPLAPRLEATLPEKPSEYAHEGTVAHSVCEIAAKKKFKKAKAAEYNRVIKKLKTDEVWDDEMLHTAETYVEHLTERAMEFANEPYIAFEVKVDISDYVPEAFGRCDCVMFGGDTLIITDYKHGKGVPVSPEENPQLMLYALGALKLYQPLFGDALKNVTVYIDQPRINAYGGWTCSVDELLARLRVALRRARQDSGHAGAPEAVFTNGELKIDYAAGCTYLAGQEVHLTPIEYKLLCLLAKNVGKVLTHNFILKEVWGSALPGDTPSLRVFMATLRKKIEPVPAQPKYIQTHVGVGYRMLRIAEGEPVQKNG